MKSRYFYHTKMSWYNKTLWVLFRQTPFRWSHLNWWFWLHSQKGRIDVQRFIIIHVLPTFYQPQMSIWSRSIKNWKHLGWSNANSKPFLIYSVFRPPYACADWICLFEHELSLAQTTGLEYLVMGDINIDCKRCSNSKWEIFYSTVWPFSTHNWTNTLSTIIDHVYTIELGNITECFVPQYAISDRYPVCLTRKI